MKIEQRITQLGLKLQECPQAAAQYVPYIVSGKYIFTAGQTPKIGTELKYIGKVGRDIEIAEAYKAAELCALRCVSVLKASISDLDKIKRIIKVVGYVNSTEDFTLHPKVINGASNVLEAIFGDKGKHARVAIGVNSLPGGAPVELELIAEIQ
ncbi:RidA family protein [Clostridium sp. 'deep sea']|uniref:RidA family protein n=1 Tax=Clostridium sp. 'deep sea' TaxID=2779445 RepID=UPI0018964C95|nr:RidA family protein [Clostridium sp. 'deep sea']QOR35273.1 RidA family protein [Clostridium sp. 'deep sea']